MSPSRMFVVGLFPSLPAVGLCRSPGDTLAVRTWTLLPHLRFQGMCCFLVFDDSCIL